MHSLAQIAAKSQRWRPPPKLAQATCVEFFDFTMPSSMILQSGDLVSQVADLGGNGRHAIQGTTARQPPLSPTGFNSRTSVTNNADRVLIVSAGGGYTTQVRRVMVNTYPTQWLIVQTGSSNYNNTLNVADMAVPHVYSHTWVTATYSTWVDGNPDQTNVASTFNANNPGGVFWATTITTTPISSGTIRAVIDGGVVGERDSTATTEGFVGGMAFWLLYAGTVSTTERTFIEGFLTWATGLQANLPGGHRFRGWYPTVADWENADNDNWWEERGGLIQPKRRLIVPGWREAA